MVPQLKDKSPKWHTGVLRAPVMDEAPCKTFGEKGVDIIWGGMGGREARCEGHHSKGPGSRGRGCGRRRRARDATEQSGVSGWTRTPKTHLVVMIHQNFISIFLFFRLTKLFFNGLQF